MGVFFSNPFGKAWVCVLFKPSLCLFNSFWKGMGMLVQNPFERAWACFPKPFCKSMGELFHKFGENDIAVWFFPPEKKNTALSLLSGTPAALKINRYFKANRYFNCFGSSTQNPVQKPQFTKTCNFSKRQHCFYTHHPFSKNAFTTAWQMVFVFMSVLRQGCEIELCREPFFRFTVQDDVHMWQAQTPSSYFCDHHCYYCCGGWYWVGAPELAFGRDRRGKTRKNTCFFGDRSRFS